MTKNKLFATITIVVFAVLFTLQCGRSNRKSESNREFAAFIAAHTSGTISSGSFIRVILTHEISDIIEFDKPIKKDLFGFSPKIKGEAFWLDNKTVEFRPANRLPSNTSYNVEFDLSELIENLPEGMDIFDFNFQTIEQSFEVLINNVKTYEKHELKWQKILGNIQMADFANYENVEKMISATQAGAKLKFRWEHDADGKIHSFIIDSVLRKEAPEKVLLKWNGNLIDVENKGERIIEVPSLDDYKLIDARVIQSPEQYVLLQFSDPLDDKQNLDGLISIENNSNLKFIVEDNEIRVYPASRQVGTKVVKIEKGVKNVLGYKIKNPTVISLIFEEVKPAIKLIGNGVILPSSNGLIFPFEAINLRAVDVKITKVFENNVLQFLQVNDFNGNREMKRVGRVIMKKSIKLDASGKVDFGKWNNYSLDLSSLIKAEPGAIYKVILSFKKEYSVFSCDGKVENKELEMMHEITDKEDDRPDGYYYDDYYDDEYYDDEYDWSERENPCNSSYYNSSRNGSKNIIASDIGLIAKKGISGNLLVYATDIKTTIPITGVTIELYNYQQQKIYSEVTNSEGLAEFEVTNKPYFVVAKKEKQKGYLKIDDGLSLSYSAFDVSGDVVQKGLKGFIYTERGVWRPGDSLYVMFILEDKEKLLPKSHPVVFELTNPLGQIVSRLVKNNSLNGFYNFSTSTSPDAITGNYSLNIKVGGASFSKTLKIETIMPNRLKLNLDFGKESISVLDKDIKATLNAKWLHGAIAKNLKAKVDVILTKSGAQFKKYEKYHFDDPARKFENEEQTIYEGNIDDKGNAIITPTIVVKENAPGALKAHFTVRVFEEGGNFSIDRFSMPYFPYSTYVGMQLPKSDNNWGMHFTDTMHRIKIVTLNANGIPVPNVKLKTEVFKVDWRWWWDSNSDNLSNYASSSYHKPILKGDIITDASGNAEYGFRINSPLWGRFLIRIIDEQSGHATGQIIYMDWPGWIKRDNSNNPGGATMLVFSSDKEKYTVGETAKLTIPSSEGGRALVSIENGSKIVKSFWKETQKGQTVVEIPITSEMAPNVYVAVTTLQPHAQAINDLPIRQYGVIPVLVENLLSHINPIIKMPDVLQPETDVSVSISEQTGKPMTYTIAVVDEGLLDLTRFKTPNPWPAFYAREALGVKTWDLYDYVIGAYGAELQHLLSIGGDESLEKNSSKKANRFKPVVKFLGPFELKSGAKQTHSFKMPQYVGSVKTMVIAGNDGAYGYADKVTPVRKPLMILATLPRVLGPEEVVKLPVTVFAMEKSVKNVTVEIFPEKPLELIGDSKKIILFSEPGDKVLNFDLKVAKVLGVGKVKIVAHSGNEKAVFDLELDVRNANPKIVTIIDTLLEPGQSWARGFNLPGMIGTNKGTLEISTIPSLNLEKRLRYLIEYPHGCIEQTTSSVFPQLFLGNLVKLDNITSSKIAENIKAGINRLRSFQTSGGGFAYWPGGNEPNEWGSSYAGHFMLEAEELGYVLPFGMKESWKKYQKQMALSWIKNMKTSYYNDDLIQAYRLYTLAKAKSPELGAMNRLKENGDLSLQARWSLAAAYALAGQPEVSKQLINGLSKSVRTYRELSYSYGSSERDEAMILETLILLNDKVNSNIVFKKVAEELGKDKWMSTQTAAYCLLSASKFLSKMVVSKEMNVEYKIDKKSATPLQGNSPVVQIDLNSRNKEVGAVELVNRGKGTVFIRLVLQGIPSIGDQSVVENNIKFNVNYRLANGKSIDPSRLEQGTDFIAEVTISNPGMLGDYNELALTQIFPSGWEIQNLRMGEVGNIGKSAIPTYQDVRDDRIYTYFNLRSKESKTFLVSLNAAYLGRYYLPTVVCEAMYDNNIHSRKPGKWVEVVNTGE